MIGTWWRRKYSPEEMSEVPYWGRIVEPVEFFFCDYLPDILTRPAMMPDPYQSNPEEQTNERLRKEPAMSTGFTN